VAAARAQERQYASQGKAVEKVAVRQKRAARARQTEARDTKGAADLSRARGQVVVRDGHVFTFKPSGGTEPRGLKIVKRLGNGLPAGNRAGKWVTVDHGHERGMTVGEANPGRAAHQATVLAPALKVLDQTTRPAHAIAGAAYAGVTGKDVLKGALRGAELKDRHLFGDVLRKAGVGGPLASIGGFALDVAADPTTYTTLGAGSVAKRAASKEAERVAAKATRAGMSEAGVRTVSERAGRRAAEAAPAGKGITVKVAGREVPGVRRGTAAVGRGAKRAAAHAPGPVKRAGGGARELAREVRPTMRPAGADEAQHLAGRRAARKARAAVNQADVDNQAYARALHGEIGPANYERVIRAIETRTLHKLGDPELHQAAVSLRSRFRHAQRMRKYAGVGEGEVGGIRSHLEHPEARPKPAPAADIGSRQEYIAGRPKPARGTPDPTIERLSENVKPGKPGVSIESEYVRMVDPETRAPVGFGRELPGSKVVVARDAQGKPIGVLKMILDRQGKPSVMEIAVDPAHRGKGIGTSLARTAHEAGYDVVSAAREGGLTEAGAALTHKGLGVKAAMEAQAAGAPRRLTARTVTKRNAGPKGYFPHARQDVLEAGLGISDAPVEGVRRGGGRTVTRPGSSKAREGKQPIHELNPQRVAEGKEPFSTNVPLVALNYGNETARVVAKANLIKDLAAAGRPVKAGRDVQLKDGEAVYRLGFEPGGRSSVPLRAAKDGAEVVLRSAKGRGTFGLREVDDREVQRVLGGLTDREYAQALAKLDPNEAGYEAARAQLRARLGPGKQGHYVVLNRKTVEDALASAKPAQSTKTSARVFDRAQGTWKRVATSTPGFHIRNLLGDTQMAYLEQPGHKLPRNIGQAGKAVRRDSQQARRAGRSTAAPAASKKTIKVAGTRVPLDDFLAGARKHGVLDTGYVGRQLEDLTNPAGVSGAARVKRGTGGTVKRWMKNRENLLRVATYKHGLDKGLSEEEAADLAASIHIDYGDVTETERVFGRRVAPFYTFTARAGPLHAKKLVTNPGKFANFEKLREEVGQAVGGGGTEEQQRARMQEYQQRQLPFVIKIGGGPKAIAFSPPMNLLNELPVTSPGKYLDELGKFGFGLVSPAVKTPVELYSNQSFYFRRPIEDEKRPLVAAPGWVQHLPEGMKKTLAVTPNFVDPRTGKKVWGWRGRADYLVKLFPGPFNLANQLATSGTNRRGQGEAAKVIAGLSGVRADPLDATAAQAAQAVGIVKRLAVLNRRAGALNQQGVNDKKPTPEYRKIRGEINRLGKVLEASHRNGGAAGPPDPETSKLLREAQHEGAAAAPSADEIQKLLREAGVR
jgi:GNAT superfamily N-acetyltransferase